jgi:zinc finger BED domain-containing protein 5/7/8/9
VFRRKKKKNHIRMAGRIAALEDIFDICWDIHKTVGHQGRDTMLKEAKKFYDNITRPIVVLFLNFSEEYQVKRKKIKNHGLVVKPIRSSNFNSRWQIDLIDFRTLPDGDYNWILTVQDHCTKFVWLIPLKQKTGLEVAKALFDLFGIFGAPCILQSDNGKEFRNQIVYGLKLLWPGLEIIHGRPRRPQSQGSVERANGDVQNILGSWMRSNNSTKWATALPIVCNIKNRKFHSGKNR